jgi:ATP-dependent helicase/nuclease subunit A
VLGDALLLPDDDLALATVLKSPLFGLDDDRLFALAYDRKKPLRTMLREKSADDPMFAAAHRALNELAALAHQLTPFAFYAHVLGALRGRERFLARLGADADDPLDEFLNLALDYERRETPSLQGFLHWVRVGQNEVKRDMEMGRDEVRVMTVHGAKGLEARKVILIDATTVRPEGAYALRLLEAQLDGAPDAKALIWAAAKDKDAGPMAAAREAALAAARDEYRRLLYVGMTRAADHLVICATKGVNKIPDGCWYQLVCDALKPLAAEETDADGTTLWRLRKAEAVAEPSEAEELTRIVLPDWARQPVAAAKPRWRVLSPSSTEDVAQRFAGRGDRDTARRRGTLLHRLMQSLPDIAPERRTDAARTFLAHDDDLTAAERDAMTAQALAILADTRFAPLFAPGSRAEVSVAGLVGDVAVAGQIDRLVVTNDAVLIADYKSDGTPPQRIADVPASYVRQLALYRALLAKVYPGKVVRAALLWTETPELMELSGANMDAALAQLTSA